jgi:hypothetical protein
MAEREEEEVVKQRRQRKKCDYTKNGRREHKRPYTEAERRVRADPEHRARQSIARKELIARRKAEGNPIRFGRLGIPDGMRRLEADLVWAVSAKLARLDMAELKQAGVLDGADAKAEEALQAALEVMRSPMKQADRLAAARLVLDFTKAKPASKTDLTINKAEEWLSSVVADNAQSRSSDASSDEGEAS